MPNLQLQRRLIEPSDTTEEIAFDDTGVTIRRAAESAFVTYLEKQPDGRVPLNDSAASWQLFNYLFMEYLTDIGLELQFKDVANQVWSRLSAGTLVRGPLSEVDKDDDSLVREIVKKAEAEMDGVHAEIGHRLKNFTKNPDQ